MRNVIAFFILWLCLIVQSTIFQVPPIHALHPDFILVVLITVALTRGSRTAMVLGVMIGLVEDSVFGTFLGLNAFTYGVLAYFAGAAVSQFLHRNVAITFLVTVIATCLQQWFTFALARMFDVTTYTWRGVAAHSILQMIQNGLVLLLLYPALTRLFRVRSRATYVQEKADST